MNASEARARLDAARERKSDAVRAWSAADDAGDERAARNASARMRYWEARMVEAYEVLHPVLAVDVDTLPMLDWAAPRTDYSRTPIWTPRRGLCVHIGGGVFVTVCGECDHAMRSLGGVPRYATVGAHEVAEHGALVPGINVGMLP